MRLDKFLSDTTAHSRKELKSFIRRGTVTVDGNVVKSPEFQVTESSVVTLNG
ncbi:MAG: 16S rRNA pseudouridine(516) synthase, partial [Lentisphaeria bacterium]|nr:16S rRNA pseudouridine(516) synthase [Lentisphaeria bacterium]